MCVCVCVRLCVCVCVYVCVCVLDGEGSKVSCAGRARGRVIDSRRSDHLLCLFDLFQ